MDTNALFYKIQKQCVTSKDYVKWSHNLLENNVSSPSLKIIASFSEDVNLFMIEDYFRRAMSELQIQEPDFETTARGYINLMTKHILMTDDQSELFNLAKNIFNIVATELYYPDDLIEWYEISEMIDLYQYRNEQIDFCIEDLIFKIKEEGKVTMGKYS